MAVTAGTSAPATEIRPFHVSFSEEEIDDLQRRFPGLGDFSAWWFMQSVGLPVPPAG